MLPRNTDKLLWVTNAEVTTDLSCQVIIDVTVSGDGRTSVLSRVVPPGMPTALAQQLATIRFKEAEQVATFYTAISSSS